MATIPQERDGADERLVEEMELPSINNPEPPAPSPPSGLQLHPAFYVTSVLGLITYGSA
jgi:hypothetical protein